MKQLNFTERQALMVFIIAGVEYLRLENDLARFLALLLMVIMGGIFAFQANKKDD
jgi:hypothetical protein